MKNILIRTDSSSTIGTGHVMRDLVLAKKFPKDNIFFATQNLEGNINYRIKEMMYDLHILNSNCINELIKLIKNLKIDMIVIDQYDIDFLKEKKIKDETNIEIFVLDDFYQKHYCDTLLNHNIGAQKEKYSSLVPSFTKILCGHKYALIREEFLLEKKRVIDKKSKIKIFLIMGGIDLLNLNVPIIHELQRFSNLEIDVVTTSSNKNLINLKKTVARFNNVKLYTDSNNIAKLMNESSLVITTPSVTINEVFFLEKPFIAIKVANNQNDIYDYLKDNNYAVMENFSKNQFNKMLDKFIKGFESE